MNTSQVFWTNISLFKKVLLLNDEAISDILDLELSKFLCLKNKNKIPEITHVNLLLSKLNISFNDFFEEKFDLFQIREQFLGNIKSLPMKYSFSKYSSSRTIINCLGFLEKRFGSNFTSYTLRALQVDGRFFEKADRWININFSRDFFNLLRQAGLSDQDFIDMGKASYSSNIGTELGKELSGHRKLIELIEDICVNHSRKFDHNFNYFINKVDKNSIYIGSRATREAFDAFRGPTIITPEVCLTKMGVFNSFSNYIRKNSEIQKTKCLFRGDKFFEYKITAI